MKKAALYYNKKGMTLVELICGIAVLSIAMMFGVAVFAVGAKGYARGAGLQTQVNAVARYFETNKSTADITPSSLKKDISFTFGDELVTFKNTPITNVISEDSSSKCNMLIYTNSIIDVS